jgi:hypothetical protein
MLEVQAAQVEIASIGLVNRLLYTETDYMQLPRKPTGPMLWPFLIKRNAYLNLRHGMRSIVNSLKNIGLI